MAHEFSGSAVIDRPIDEVFAFLADGTNDPKFSPRVQEIRKTTDGPVGVGTVRVGPVPLGPVDGTHLWPSQQLSPGVSGRFE